AAAAGASGLPGSRARPGSWARLELLAASQAAGGAGSGVLDGPRPWWTPTAVWWRLPGEALPRQLPVQRSTARAQLQAVERAPAHAVPPTVLHCDRQRVLDGVAAGRAWCVCVARPEDLGLGPAGVLLQKTTAPQTAAGVARLEAAELQIARASAEADRLAGQGAGEGVKHPLEHV
ncbi:unnamed protein product, partial [Prorocentrum cordatum]